MPVRLSPLLEEAIVVVAGEAGRSSQGLVPDLSQLQVALTVALLNLWACEQEQVGLARVGRVGGEGQG